jgi:formylglycine-generating enzyme required for sulfatase activity
MKTTNLFGIILALLVANSPALAVTIDVVTVGNPGNAPDTRYNAISVGSVPYAYQIGKYEVTAGQYTEFLNAVAKNDPNGLYNTNMVNSLGANIQRSGSSPNFSYSVPADWANRPVNYVSFWDAARFANWLQNGQPTGLQGPGTTEDGAYHDVGNQALFGREASARFVIPTEDEWYKAAYHNQSAGLAASYFDYPTGSNSAPTNTLPDPGNHANFYDGTYTIGFPYYRTNGGEFVNSASPYGTFDQGGNVWEWNETIVFSTVRGLRGSSFDGFSLNLRARSRLNQDPTFESLNTGFRIATVPEPSTLLLIAIASFGLSLRRRSVRTRA